MRFEKSCWRIKKLDQAKYLELGRAYETSRQQSQSMSKSDTISAQVNRIPAKQGKQNPWKVNHAEGFQRSGNRASKKCTRCGKSPMHGRKDCPAKEAECRKCFVKGHYEAMCRSKKTLRRLEEEEDVILGVITAVDSRKRAKSRGAASVNSLELQDPWHTKILDNGKKVNFRVDTGAAVTVVPRRYFTKNSPLIQKTNKKLFGPGKTKIDVIGQFQATLTTEHTETKQTMFVVGNLQEPLLGRSAIEALHLLERVNTLQSQGSSDQNNVVQRSWKAEISIQNHDGEPCKAIFYCNSSSIAAANETESRGRTETYGGGRRHTPRQKSD